MAVRKFIITAALFIAVCAATPAKASADWLFTPFVGVNWGGSASFNTGGFDFEDEFEKRMTFGASLGWMGDKPVGFEFDLGFAPNFFENTAGDDDFPFGDSNVTTLMANVVVGAPQGRVRPYATAGVGIIRSQIDDAEDLFDDLSTNDWGFNVGGGVNGFFSDRVGIRGDVRYFRSLQDNEPDDEFDLALGSFNFWRGTVGLVFRF
jgi:opacity protein-like surface antigen